MHYIFDEAARLSTKLFTSAGIFGWVACVEGFKGSADNSAELANGWIIKADTIAELAEKIGRDPVARAGDHRPVERVLRRRQGRAVRLHRRRHDGAVHAAGSSPGAVHDGPVLRDRGPSGHPQHPGRHQAQPRSLRS